jgi:hypothetical protein
MPTQRELLINSRKDLNAAWHEKYPEGRFTLVIRTYSAYVHGTTHRLDGNGKPMVYTSISVARDFSRPTSSTRGIGPTVMFFFAPVPYGSALESLSVFEGICPASFEEVRTESNHNSNELRTSRDFFGTPGLGDRTSSYASRDKLLSALKKKGAGPRVLALVEHTMTLSRDDVYASFKRRWPNT